MHPFEAYLKAHTVDPLQLSIEAHVRYSTIWNAIKGVPITPAHAQKVRNAVFKITSVPYLGHLVLTEPVPIEDMQTIPIQKISRK